MNLESGNIETSPLNINTNDSVEINLNQSITVPRANTDQSQEHDSEPREGNDLFEGSGKYNQKTNNLGDKGAQKERLPVTEYDNEPQTTSFQNQKPNLLKNKIMRKKS